MIAALLKEIDLTVLPPYTTGSENEIIETIYFGGGTPSLLNHAGIKSILTSIKNNYLTSEDAEITIEANPDDVTHEKLIAWKEAGINRLSIGIQSFKEQDLQWMNRAHNRTQAIECITNGKRSRL